MGKVIFKENQYTFEQIKHGHWHVQDPYIESSLLFCKAWLDGQQTFPLKTSGSTGLPKTITIYRSQMEVSAVATKAFLGTTASDRLLCCLNTEMIGGKMMLVRALEWGCEVVVAYPQENPLAADWIDLEINFAAMVPIQVEACLEDAVTRQKLKKIQKLIIGGTPTSGTLSDQLSREKITAYQTYGMTETVSHIALARIEAGDLTYLKLPSVTIGVDEGNRLWVEGPMAGNQRIQTHDIVNLIDQHTFTWLGRSDFTINSGGIKIQPEQLEKELADLIERNFGPIRFFVGGIPDSKLGEKAVLFLETGHLSRRAATLLLSEAKGMLPKFHTPKEVFCAEKFIETPSGKIDRPATIAGL